MKKATSETGMRLSTCTRSRARRLFLLERQLSMKHFEELRHQHPEACAHIKSARVKPALTWLATLCHSTAAIIICITYV